MACDQSGLKQDMSQGAASPADRAFAAHGAAIACDGGKPGEGGKPLGPVERFQIKDWLRGFETRHADADALDLLP